MEEREASIELLRGECRRKDGEIAALKNEKETIIRNKINEFRQNEYIDKIHELQSVARLRELELKEMAAQLESSHTYRVKAE